MDYAFDAVRAVWVALIVCIVVFNLDMGRSFVIGTRPRLDMGLFALNVTRADGCISLGTIAL